MKRPIDGNRLLHILGVAEYMYTKATDYNLDPDEMYLIGILHDIGFINDYSDDSNYQEYGDEILKKIGLTSKKGKLIRDIIKLNNSVPDFKMDWNNKIHRIKYLLYEADMSISSVGRQVSYDGRLQNLYEYYDDDDIFEKGKAIVEWLEQNIKK